MHNIFYQCSRGPPLVGDGSVWTQSSTDKSNVLEYINFLLSDKDEGSKFAKWTLRKYSLSSETFCDGYSMFLSFKTTFL